MIVALIGNPNSGKSTLFNALTKLKQKIGNWPGVTVEKKQGKYWLDNSIEIVDLPGIYSLHPLSDDERVAYDFVVNQKPDVIINIIDSSNLERSLALTLQLIETNIPIVLGLNMQDELQLHGLTLDLDCIQQELGVQAVTISARKNKNIKLLMQKAVETAQKQQQSSFVSQGQTEEQKTQFRHDYIASQIDKFRIKTQSKIKNFTEKLDSIILNRWLAFPIFAAIVFVIFFVSIQTVGEYTIQGVEWFFFDFFGDNLANGLQNIGSPEWVVSLSVDGIINGVGTVLAFVPQIAILFVFITFLEGCGYMSRVAIIMDRLFRRIGLNGKSFIPMIVGCGCSVPAIMSAKTIEGDTERKTTIMLVPFVPCSAKLPVFALIAGALFPHNPFVAPSMYFLGIAMVIVGGLILKAIFGTKRQSDTFLFELGVYRMPHYKNILMELWGKVKGFVTRAFVVILPAAIILWFLQSFSLSFRMVDIEDSMLAGLGKGIAWIFAPLGFGNWQSSIAIITGIFAKETIVATFGVILTGDLDLALAQIFTPQAALAFMAFILLSAPCIAAIAATKKELGSAKLMFGTIAFQCAMGYVVALIINQVGNLWANNRAASISLIAGAIVLGIFWFSIKRVLKKSDKGTGCSGGCSGCSGCKKG